MVQVGIFGGEKKKIIKLDFSMFKSSLFDFNHSKN